MKIFHSVLFLLLSLICFSQTVTHGPVVGGVTDSSCRVFVRTDAATSVTIEISTSATFISIVSSATGMTDGSRDNIASFTLANLLPDANYFVRILINGTPTGETAT